MLIDSTAHLDGGHGGEGVAPGLEIALLLCQQDLRLPRCPLPAHRVSCHNLRQRNTIELSGMPLNPLSAAAKLKTLAAMCSRR